jgi:hypothetical protein
MSTRVAGPQKAERPPGDKLFKVHIVGTTCRPTSNFFWNMFTDRDHIDGYPVVMVTQFLETLKEFPPRHEPATFTID